MKSFIDYLNESCTCWTGYKRKPGSKPCAEDSCVKEEHIVEAKEGLWANIHAKQKRIKAGSGEHMRKPGSKGAPTTAALKASQNEESMAEGLKDTVKQKAKEFGKYMTEPDTPQQAVVRDRAKNIAKIRKNKEQGVAEGLSQTLRKVVPGYAKREIDKKMDAGKFGKTDADKDANFQRYKKIQDKIKDKGVAEELSLDEQFDLIEELVMDLAEEHNIDPEVIWEKFESIDDSELYEAAVDAKGHKSSTGGLTQKGRDAYNAKGAHLQAPVTTKPSKLKKGSKAANRRKSFCARMGGMEGAMKKPNGEPTRKALALRKWNC